MKVSISGLIYLRYKRGKTLLKQGRGVVYHSLGLTLQPSATPDLGPLQFLVRFLQPVHVLTVPVDSNPDDFPTIALWLDLAAKRRQRIDFCYRRRNGAQLEVGEGGEFAVRDAQKLTEGV